MGRWLKKIENMPDSILTKLTEPSFVSFVSDQNSHISKNTISCVCKYQPPFCLCNYTPLKMVTCDSCKYFAPDNIGDGAGIGNCSLEINWTHELNGRLPLYRFANRYCKQFSKMMF